MRIALTGGDVGVDVDFTDRDAGLRHTPGRREQEMTSEFAPSKEVSVTAQIIPLIQSFNPMSTDAETRYDRVALRINRLKATRNMCQHNADELARQFVENDLIASSGSRRGKSLTVAGRRRRLRQLLDLEQELSAVTEEIEGLSRTLDHMNQALDDWARQTYGL
jgi:hypothetical protein